jgi:hypothetical protein
MITREWLENEITALRKELAQARYRLGEETAELSRAGDRYNLTLREIETLQGCILGLGKELEYLENN